MNGRDFMKIQIFAGYEQCSEIVLVLCSGMVRSVHDDYFLAQYFLQILEKY